MLHDFSPATGGALECRVVDDHQFAVAGKMQIQLAAAHAVLEALLEAHQGVFWRFALGAAMAVDECHGCKSSLGGDGVR